MFKTRGRLFLALAFCLVFISCRREESKPHPDTPSHTKIVSQEEFKKDLDVTHKEVAEELSKNPNSSYWHGQNGLILMAKGNMVEAEKEFQLAVKLDPQYSYNYLFMGVFYRQLGRKDEAKKSFEKLIELRPKSPIAHISLAENYYQPNGMHQDALRECMIAQILVESVPQPEQGLEPGVISGAAFTKDGVSKLCKQYREKAGISYWQERTMFKQVKQELANNRKQFPQIKPTDAKIIGYQDFKFGTPRKEIESFVKGKAHFRSKDTMISYSDEVFGRDAEVNIFFIDQKLYRVQVVFLIISSEKNQMLQAFEEIADIISRQYGSPTNTEAQRDEYQMHSLDYFPADQAVKEYRWVDAKGEIVLGVYKFQNSYNLDIFFKDASLNNTDIIKK